MNSQGNDQPDLEGEEYWGESFPVPPEDVGPEADSRRAAEAEAKGQKLQAADKASREQSATQTPDELTAPCPEPERYALEAVVVDADGKPLVDVAVELSRSDTEVMSGKTDTEGLVRFHGLEQGSYKLCLWKLDQDAWEVVESEPLPPEAATSTMTATWQPPGDSAGPEPVTHVVEQGECLSGLAERYGYTPESLWGLPENKSLTDKRKHGNILYPGDQVFIPAPRRRTEPVEPGNRYHIQRTGVAEVLQVRFLDSDDEPRIDVPYVLRFMTQDGEEYREGRTNGEGFLIESVSPNVDTVEITLGEEEDQEFHSLQIGHLDPLDEISGVQDRLSNLGYDCGDEEGELGPLTRRALEDFQRDLGLEVTGDMDAATLEKLEQLHLS